MQLAAVEAIDKNNNVLLLSATGSGKTLAYLLPLIKWLKPANTNTQAIIIVPSRELALQIMDYKRNGHKNKAQLIGHARDTLVKAGWNMGEGRTPPPLSYDAFVTAWDTWIKTGAYAPKR